MFKNTFQVQHCRIYLWHCLLRASPPPSVPVSGMSVLTAVHVPEVAAFFKGALHHSNASVMQWRGINAGRDTPGKGAGRGD